MKDRDFLFLIHERLEHVHGEKPLVDYMHKLRSIILATPKEKISRKEFSCNGMEELKRILDNQKCCCKGFYKPNKCPIHGK